MSHTENTPKKRRGYASKQTLREVKQQIAKTYPLIKRLKVKTYYNNGKIRINASIGRRRIHATGLPHQAISFFAKTYNERYPTAF